MLATALRELAVGRSVPPIVDVRLDLRVADEEQARGHGPLVCDRVAAPSRARPTAGSRGSEGLEQISSRKGGGLVDAPDARIVRKKGKYPLRAAYRRRRDCTVLSARIAPHELADRSPSVPMRNYAQCALRRPDVRTVPDRCTPGLADGDVAKRILSSTSRCHRPTPRA